MSLILQPLARTTPRTRVEPQAEDRNLSNAALTRVYGITELNVSKRRGRDSTIGRSLRPDTLHCTLTVAKEVVAMASRRTLSLPRNDLLTVVRESHNPPRHVRDGRIS